MVCPFWKTAFPQLVSYSRFVEIMLSCLQALTTFFHQVKGKDTGISIIDSTKITVCHKLRIQRHRVFKSLGEIINLTLTSGNVHDTTVIEKLTGELKGVLLGDKGYLSKAKTEILASRGLRLITPKHRNIKQNKPTTATDKALLSKRGLIETVNDQLKNLHHIEHSRHRSVFNFMVNMMAAVVTYYLSPNKPKAQRMIQI